MICAWQILTDIQTSTKQIEWQSFHAAFKPFPSSTKIMYYWIQTFTSRLHHVPRGRRQKSLTASNDNIETAIRSLWVFMERTGLTMRHSSWLIRATLCPEQFSRILLSVLPQRDRVTRAYSCSRWGCLSIQIGWHNAINIHSVNKHHNHAHAG